MSFKKDRKILKKQIELLNDFFLENFGDNNHIVAYIKEEGSKVPAFQIYNKERKKMYPNVRYRVGRYLKKRGINHVVLLKETRADAVNLIKKTGPKTKQTEENIQEPIKNTLESGGNIKDKQPWEMTQKEWNYEREEIKPNVAQSNYTRNSKSEAITSMERLFFLLYGVNDKIREKLQSAIEGKIEMSPEEAEEIQEIINTPVTHKRVIQKALAENKPVPPEVLADYPDLKQPETIEEKLSWQMTRDEFFQSLQEDQILSYKNREVSDLFHDHSILKNIFRDEIDKDYSGKGIKRPINGINEGLLMNTLKKEISDKGSFLYAKKKIIELYKKALAENKPVPPEVLADYPELKKEEEPQAWQMRNDEFGSVTIFDPKMKTKRYNIQGEAQEIRIKEEGSSEYFTTTEAAQKWINNKHKEIIKKALAEGKPVPSEVLISYPELLEEIKDPEEKAFKLIGIIINLNKKDLSGLYSLYKKAPETASKDVLNNYLELNIKSYAEATIYTDQLINII